MTTPPPRLEYVPPGRIAALLDNAPQTLTFAGAGLLILSTAYDFSYLYALGLGFNDVPTTLTDHVRSALVWAPKALVYALVIALYEMAVLRLENGRGEEELIARSRFPRLVRGFRNSARWLFVALVVLALAVDLAFTTSGRALYLGALVGWGTLAFWFVTHERLGAGLTRQARRLIVIAPVFVLWVGFMGYMNGREALEGNGPAWQVALKVDGSTQQRQVKGLRRFTTSTILVGADGKVDVIPHENIASTTLLHTPGTTRSRLCAWFRIGCESSASSPAR
jgi:hypothetical protein